MAKVVLDLKCKLTPKELQEKAQEMATAVIQYDEFEDEKKAQAKELGDKMKDLHLTLSKLAKITRSKAEHRPVECDVELNVPEVGTKRITRSDTKEIIKEMPMTMEERQTNLFSDSIEELNKLFNLPSDPPAAESSDQPGA